jgi:hypothetical protein
MPYRDLLLNLFRISKVNAVCQTDIVGARRNQPPIHPMVAEVAFLGDTLNLIETDGIVRACVDADFTTGTELFLQHHNAVVSALKRVAWTHVEARGIGAVRVRTSVHLEDKCQPAIDTFRSIFGNRNQLDTVIDTVFLLARHLAGHAPPTGGMIDK